MTWCPVLEAGRERERVYLVKISSTGVSVYKSVSCEKSLLRQRGYIIKTTLCRYREFIL